MWVSRVLGHQDPALTLRTYTHVLERENDDLGFLEGGLTIRDRSGTVRDKRSTRDLQVVGKYGDPGAIREAASLPCACEASLRRERATPQLRRLVQESSEFAEASRGYEILNKAPAPVGNRLSRLFEGERWALW